MRRLSCLTFLIALVPLLLLSSCGGGRQWWETVRWEDYALDTLPRAQDFPGEGAVILLDEGKMETFGSGPLGYSVFEQRRLVRVFDTRGERYANVVLPYGSSSEIEEIEARTITPEGTIVPLRAEDIHDVSLYPEFVFYSDRRAKLFTMPAVEPGAVLEYRYRVRVSDRTVWHGWRFQSEAPTLISRFTMLAPSEWPISYRTYGLEVEPEIERVPSGFKSTFRWEARDLPGMVTETGMPPPSERYARLAIAPLGFRSWNDVSSWYRRLSEPRERDDEGVDRLVDSLLAGVTEPDRRMRILYEWVRDHVRYLAVEIGIGGYQPHRAAEICANRYGDCKDMATILSAMGDAAGIRVDQVLISTWQNGIPDTSLPSPYQFNHAIVFAPEIRGGLWMDPTAKGAPYGELPWYNQGAPALVVGDNGEALLTVTPRSAATENAERTRWSVTLDDSGGARVRSRTVLTGALAMEARDALAYATETERRRWIGERLPREFASGATVTSTALEGLAPVRDSLTVEAEFTAPAFAMRENGELRLQPGLVIASGLPELFHPGPRMHPVRFRFGLHRILDMSLILPAGWRSHTEGGEDSVTTAFGAWRTERSDSAGLLRYRRDVRLEPGEVVPADYDGFRQYLEGLRRSELRPLILRWDGRGGPAGETARTARLGSGVPSPGM